MQNQLLQGLYILGGENDQIVLFHTIKLSRALTRFLFSSITIFIILLASSFPRVLAPAPAQAAGFASAGSCQPFSQVNDGAFGMGTGPNPDYYGEEGFEVAVFSNQLYMGMEADSTMGARIWRTRPGVSVPYSQADWEEVAADANGWPFGVENIPQNDHIDSLAEFNGYIYASTANGGTNRFGTRIFRSPSGSPASWEDAIVAYGAGFGDIYNTNFKDMQVFQGFLCGGTQNVVLGAQVWCTLDGATWTQKNVSGFGNGNYNNRNLIVWSGYVYDGALYFGVQNLGALRGDSNDDVGKLFRTTDLDGNPDWSEIYSGPAGSHRVDILGDLNGYLFISTRSSGGIVIFRSPSGDSNSWEPVNVAGMDGDANNLSSLVDNATIYDSVLYLAVSNTVNGLELWRTTGEEQGGSLVAWELIDTNGLGDYRNIYAQLIPFNENLYAWTSNYTTGQQVLRSNCLDGAPPPEPTSTPTPTPTDTPTETPTATNPPTDILTQTPTDTPLPTQTPTNTPEPSLTNTAAPTETSTTTTAPTETATSTPTPISTSDVCLQYNGCSQSPPVYKVFLPVVIRLTP